MQALTNALRIPESTTSRAVPEKWRPCDEVWVAEDNADVRLMLAQAFRRRDPHLQAVFFEHGGELIEYSGKNHSEPRLLLLDLQMPVGDGLEALRAIRAEGCCGATPVVIFSVVENPEIIRAAYFSGAKLYLKKPHSLEEFEEVATLCATSAEALRALPASAIPFGALDVQRVMTLLQDGKLLERPPFANANSV